MSEKETTPEVKYCEYCDGPVLNSTCNICKGTGITPEKTEGRKLSELIVDNLKGGSYEYQRWPEMTDAVESKIEEYSKNEVIKAVELARKEGEERIREILFEMGVDITMPTDSWLRVLAIFTKYLPEKGDNNGKA